MVGGARYAAAETSFSAGVGRGPASAVARSAGSIAQAHHECGHSLRRVHPQHAQRARAEDDEVQGRGREDRGRRVGRAALGELAEDVAGPELGNRLAGAAHEADAGGDEHELVVQRAAEQEAPAGRDPQLLRRGRELAELVEAERVQVRQGSEPERLHAPVP